MYRILILDDEKPSSQMLEQLLNKKFQSIDVVSNVHTVEDAVAYLENNQVDMVLLDLQLNGESGFDLLDIITPRTFDVICLSASREYAIKAFEYCANGYLLKPVNHSELSNAINIWLNRRNQSHLFSNIH